MKIKFSGLGVVAGSGKINGTVASRNRGGAYARVLAIPTNPQTVAQQTARNNLASFSQSWRVISQALRDAWDAAVSDYAVTDVFGDLRNPSGKNLYVRINANLVSVGVAPVTAPLNPAGTSPVLIQSVTISVGTPTYEIAFAGDAPTMNYQIWATPGVSAGKSYVKNLYRQIGSVAGGGGSPYDFEADYLAKFGAPAVGSKVFIKMVPVNNTTGEKGTGSSGYAIVAV